MSESKEDDFILYSNRPEWNDLTPIPLNDGPYPVVSIAYSEKYRDVYDYFRGVVHVGEKSERVLVLCEDAARLNPANYNVWYYRRLVLRHLNSDLHKEIQYVSEMIKENLKVFQIWHHRKVIIEWLNDGTGELEITAEILNEDEKNYHAWQYRQWVLSTFKLYDNELAYIDYMLKCDVRNNSVWAHRYFILQCLPDGFSPESINKEVDYVLNVFQNPPYNNESAWNYLRGILLHSDNGLIEPKVQQFSQNLYDGGCRAVHLLAFIADSAVELFEKNIGDKKTHLENAIRIYTQLANEFDILRASYWNYVIKGLPKMTAAT